MRAYCIVYRVFKYIIGVIKSEKYIDRIRWFIVDIVPYNVDISGTIYRIQMLEYSVRVVNVQSNNSKSWDIIFRNPAYFFLEMRHAIGETLPVSLKHLKMCS